ncbi:hypothetical protein INR49_000674 [Caranx melampygus]|nr:hypothetical protein INR49_000674 [Caranx melampygus]
MVSEEEVRVQPTLESVDEDCEEQVKVSLCDQQFMKPDSRRSPYEPVEGAAEPRPLCSSSAITNMCLKSAGWWLNVSTNRYVSCLCVP